MSSSASLSKTSSSSIAVATVDQVIDAIGEWGPWQRNRIFLLGAATLLSGWSTLMSTFMNPPVDFRCVDEAAGLGLNECGRCEKWAFNRTEFKYTIVEQFELICEKSHYAATAQSAFFGGMLLGVFFHGFCSDRFGRIRSLVPVCVGTAVIGMMIPFAPGFWIFAALRFLLGFFKIGIFVIVLVWSLESVGGVWHTRIGIGLEFFWVFAWLTLSAGGFFVSDWRYLQFFGAAPGLLTVSFYWIVPESPKWLLSVGKIKEAEKIVRKIAAKNGRRLPSDWKLKPTVKNDESKGQKLAGNFFALFRSPKLALQTLVIYLNFFANSFSYYGLTLHSGNIGGSYQLNFFLNGVFELPAYAISIWIIQTKGRKAPYVALMILAAAALLSTAIIPESVEFDYNWPVVTLAMLGKFCLTMTFGIIYVYSAELYPTICRSMAVGSGSVFARIGGMVAPFVGALDKVIDPTFPIAIFGVVAAVAGLAVLLRLPETKDMPKLPDHFDEMSADDLEDNTAEDIDEDEDDIDGIDEKINMKV